MSDLSLGIDIGTSGVRTAILDTAGEVISSARANHIAQNSDKIDAAHWWQSVANCITAQGVALRKIGRNLYEVANIGVDGTSGTMMLSDGHLNPVGRALMYNSSGFDAEAAVIAKYAPPIHITKGPNSALARALRLMSEDTENNAVHLLHQADFVIAKLLGQGGHSDHNNALKLGFDPETTTWPAWFEQTHIRLSILPEALPAGAAIEHISPQIAREFGFAQTTHIHAGTTDSIAAFLAAAPLEPAAAVTSLGTTLAVKVLSKTRIDDPEVGLYSHKLGDYWLAGGASNTGGGVLASLFSADELTRLSKSIDPTQASPLEYYPLLKPGERFPVNDPSLPPRMTPRPADDTEFLHGLLESIARIEAECYKAITDQGGPTPTQLFTAGGGALNDTWTQIRARVLQTQPLIARHTEASIGIARLVQRHAV